MTRLTNAPAAVRPISQRRSAGGTARDPRTRPAAGTVAAVLASLVVVIVISASGFGLTGWLSDRLRFEERVAVGIVVGALAISAVTFLAFEVMGMGWPALLTGLVVIAAGGVTGARRTRSRLRVEVRSAW